MVSTTTIREFGKEKKGLLPVISNMPKDNHSTMQLYLDGFKNNFLLFFMFMIKNLKKLIIIEYLRVNIF